MSDAKRQRVDNGEPKGGGKGKKGKSKGSNKGGGFWAKPGSSAKGVANPNNLLNPGSADKRWGEAPPGYIPGKGRGATGFVGGVSRDEIDASDNTDFTNYDEFSGYGGSLFANTEATKEDEEADDIYAMIDQQMDARRGKKREERLKEELKKARAEKPTIKQEFADLQRELGTVTEEQWAAIPEAVIHAKTKKKENKREVFTATPDQFIASAAGMGNGAMGPTGNQTPLNSIGSATPLMMRGGTASVIPGMGGTATPMGLRTPMVMGGTATPMGLRTPMQVGGLMTPIQISQIRSGAGSSRSNTSASGMQTPMGMQTPVPGWQSSSYDLANARSQDLLNKLAQKEQKVSNQARQVDVAGYMTDLQSLAPQQNTDISDISKTRQLMKSLTTSHPNHAGGWISAARVEELAGQMQAAREKIIQGTKNCPHDEEIWLEAERLELKEAKKGLMAKAVEKNVKSVKLWMKAAELESDKIL